MEEQVDTTVEAVEAEVIETESNEEQPQDEAITDKQITGMMRQTRDFMEIMQNHWVTTAKEWGLEDHHMKMLHKFNEDHRDPLPEIKEGEENVEKEYSKFNGLEKITQEEVEEIFGKEHPIHGMTLDVTIGRLKEIMVDFFSYMVALQDYKKLHNDYIDLLEERESTNIRALEDACEREENPEKKKKMRESLDTYYSRKYLDFLAEPLDEKTINRLVEAFRDGKKIEYWVERTRARLKSMKLSSKFILEISKFEDRFLPQIYHDQSNIFLLYFMNLIIYSQSHGQKDSKVVAIIFALDKFVRNVLDEDTRLRILQNMISFEDQFLGKILKPQ